MPCALFAFLGALVQLGGSATTRDMADVSGYSSRYFWKFLPEMEQAGWVDYTAGRRILTERGKLAFAIESGRRVKRSYHRKVAA